MTDSVLTNYLVSFVLFGMIIASGVGFMAGVSEDSEEFASMSEASGFDESYNKLSELNNYSDNLREDISEDKVDDGDWGFVDTIFTQGLNKIKLMIKTATVSVSVMKDIFTQAPDDLGVPSWVGGAIISILTIILVVAIIGAFIKYRV